jgi:arsenite methyltransferase
MSSFEKPSLDLPSLRAAISEEYDAVACDPDRGYHFHTGRPHAEKMDYRGEWLDGVPEGVLASFAGTGNPWSLGVPEAGSRVVDVGCGAGIDSFIAGGMVGAGGSVIGVDMTDSMLEKARISAREAGVENVEFKKGYGEELPVSDGWADVVVSNGVLNLMPDKEDALAEMSRVLRPGGRLQIADILVSKPVPMSAKDRIELWTG